MEPVRDRASLEPQALAAYSTLGREMQDFISRRIDEDVALVRRVSHCRAQEEFVAAYAGFWRKAAEDYGKEASTLAKLMINATSRMVEVGSTAMDEPKDQRRSAARSC